VIGGAIRPPRASSDAKTTRFSARVQFPRRYNFPRLFLILMTLILLLSSCKALEKSLYPIKYEEEIRFYAKLYEIPPELLAAVIRTESNFNPQAVSSAGAVGLMQLLPSTAEEIALRMGEEYNLDAIAELETNIKYGAFYLSYLYRVLGNDWNNACAAYNGGIGNVKEWLDDKRYSDDGVSLKEIPFSETRNYLNRIEKYSEKYKELYFTDEETGNRRQESGDEGLERGD